MSNSSLAFILSVVQQEAVEGISEYTELYEGALSDPRDKVHSVHGPHQEHVLLLDEAFKRLQVCVGGEDMGQDDTPYGYYVTSP